MNKLEHMKRGFRKRCPCCGLTPIFKSYVKTYNKCRCCGIKLSDYKSDDGPAYITIFIRAIDLPFSCLVRNKNRYFRNSKLKSQENSFRVGQKVSFKIKRNDIFSGKILGENVKIIN